MLVPGFTCLTPTQSRKSYNNGKHPMGPQRSPNNPIITPDMVKPSRPDFQILGTFNAAVCEYGDKFIMLVRVAENIREQNDEYVRVPTLKEENGEMVIGIKTFDRNDKNYDFSDLRQIKNKNDPSEVYLTSVSQIRLAFSDNGEHFTVSDVAFIAPTDVLEAFGCEDARVIEIEGRYYINYSAVSNRGITTMLAVTDDFKTVEKLGLIFAPDNRDVCLFPEKINDKYWALHRPAPKHLGRPEIWITSSPDLLHWGAHRHLIGSSEQEWECNKIGGGAPMLKTEKGWLQIYHGVSDDSNYSLGAFLLDINDPTKVIARGTRA